MPVIPNCPILNDEQLIENNAKSITQAIKRLRRNLASCAACPAYEACPVLLSLNATVQTAITQVLDEWQSEPPNL